jgi:hypothetical protein
MYLAGYGFIQESAKENTLIQVLNLAPKAQVLGFVMPKLLDLVLVLVKQLPLGCSKAMETAMVRKLGLAME